MSTVAIHPTFRPTAARTARSTRTTTVGQLRLTRRGRVVVFLAGLLATLALAVYFGAGSVATQEQGETVLTEIHVVSQGQTLWQIADRIDDTGNTAAMVDRIEQMNGLETASLTIGQKLRVPVAR